MKTQLIVNPALRELLPPLSPIQIEKLEADILKDGCTDALTVWGEVIVDGHHRYDICRKHDLEFQVKRKSFENLDQAKLWMWRNQNGRRNLTRFQRAEVALKMKEVIASQTKERQRGGQGGILLVQNSAQAKKTRQILAEFADVSHDTLDRVEFLLKHADEETINKLRWDKKGTSINKEFTRMKAEIDAQNPAKPKKTRAKKTKEKKPEIDESASANTEPSPAEEEPKTEESKPEEPKTTPADAEAESPSQDEGSTQKRITITLKSSPKIKEQYCCGVKFEPDPDDDVFDWLSEEERKEFVERQKACPNRLAPQIRNFTIQNIPEHKPDQLIACLFSLFKVKYREKLAYALLRKMYEDDDPELAKSIVVTLHGEFQNR